MKLGGFTAPELENLPQVLEEFFEMNGIMFWPDIGRSIVEFFPGQKYLWIVIVRDFDIGIRIVSLEKIVVFRFIFFDEIVFEIERFAFVFDNEEIYIVGFGKHILLSYGIGRKILGDSFFEIFGFSYI